MTTLAVPSSLPPLSKNIQSGLFEFSESTQLADDGLFDVTEVGTTIYLNPKNGKHEYTLIWLPGFQTPSWWFLDFFNRPDDGIGIIPPGSGFKVIIP